MTKQEPTWTILFRRSRKGWLTWGTLPESADTGRIFEALELAGYQTATRPGNAAARATSF